MVNTEFDQQAAIVCNALSITTDLGKKAVRVALANLKTLDNKQKDYGRENLDKFGSYGVLVRTNDKLSRLVNLMKPNQKSSPANEALEDSWLDLANYALIGFIILQQERGQSK